MDIMSHNERFELLAELFKSATGFLAPGKSVPPETASDQYELDRQVAWRQWTDDKALAMALQFIRALRDERDQYDQLYAALETCDTNQIMQERDRLRNICQEIAEDVREYLNIPTPGGKPAEPSLAEAVRTMHASLKMDRELWKKDAEFYKKMWAIRGKALEMPCLTCGSTEKAIRLKNREIP